jgi:tRNA A-37 threonylcarbamoyl transferase component Bud32
MAEAPRVLNERYEVESTLGRGGMAQVYRANDRVLGRPVAVKVLSRKLSGDQRFLTRFQREAQASAGLNNPHVVSVYDTGAHDDLHYIVMEYVEGETLGSLMARDGPLPAGTSARIAADVAEALEAAHRQGLVHRDVKPGNVMIDPDGRVKVVDFGIARAATDDTLTQTGVVLGTASYLSPEQARGEGVDARSDIYSLGCVLYEMLTGRPPFEADSSVAMAYKQVNENPDPPVGSVPPDLGAVVMRALEKDPTRRFQTAAEMQAALLAALPAGPMAAATVPVAVGGDTAVMPPAEAPPPAEPPGRSRRWWIAAAVIGGLLAILGISLLAVAGPDPRETRREAREAAREQENQPPPDMGPLSVDQAYTRLTGSITEGVAAGEVDDKAGDELLRKSEEAIGAYEAGDPPGALGKLSELNQKVTEHAQSGRIAGDRAFSIQQAAEDLAMAMQADPPTHPPVADEDEEGGEGDEDSSGPGSGEPQGKAKGHDQDKGKGNGEEDD